jgi:hypothetical protein
MIGYKLPLPVIVSIFSISTDPYKQCYTAQTGNNMENIGERIVGDYLRIKEDCDFIDFNVYTRDSQGEIDVVGINNKDKKVFICEVAIHLKTGLQYTKDRRPDTAQRLINKFIKDIEYGNECFQDYEKVFMLWSPIVKDSKGKIEYNQINQLEIMSKKIMERKKVKIELMINEKFKQALEELTNYAAKRTEELKSPVLRVLQIQKSLEKHIRIKNKKIAL